MPIAKRALCVGINTFKNYPDSGLKGCVNDARSMKEALTGYFGFRANGVATLADGAATKANILGKLEELVSAAEAGMLTHLVFTLSTHGTLVPDATPHGAAHNDDAFCPHDLAAHDEQHWDLKHIITGDELYTLFARVPEQVVVECFFDTCHSGSALRSLDTLPTRKHRWLPAPHPAGLDTLAGRSHRGFVARLRDDQIEHPIVWAACRQNQTSADTCINKEWHGAFTHALLRQIKHSHGQIRRNTLLQHVKQTVKSERFTQTPELDANRTQRGQLILAD